MERGCGGRSPALLLLDHEFGGLLEMTITIATFGCWYRMSGDIRTADNVLVFTDITHHVGAAWYVNKELHKIPLGTLRLYASYFYVLRL